MNTTIDDLFSAQRHSCISADLDPFESKIYTQDIGRNKQNRERKDPFCV